MAAVTTYSDFEAQGKKICHCIHFFPLLFAMKWCELWCWRRLFRVPWTAWRFTQSILKEISPGYSLEGLMLKLKLQYFGHLMWRADSFEKTLMLGKIEGRRRRGRQRMRWLDDITDSVDMGLGRLQSWWWTGRPGVLWFMGWQSVGHDWVNWADGNGCHVLSLKQFSHVHLFLKGVSKVENPYVSQQSF